MSSLGYLANNIISVAGSARVKFIPVPPDRPVLCRQPRLRTLDGKLMARNLAGRLQISDRTASP
jgi:hypothetical protein